MHNNCDSVPKLVRQDRATVVVEMHVANSVRRMRRVLWYAFITQLMQICALVGY